MDKKLFEHKSLALGRRKPERWVWHPDLPKRKKKTFHQSQIHHHHHHAGLLDSVVTEGQGPLMGQR